MGGRPVDLAGLGWSTGSGSRRCGEEQSWERGGENGRRREMKLTGRVAVSATGRGRERPERGRRWAEDGVEGRHCLAGPIRKGGGPSAGKGRRGTGPARGLGLLVGLGFGFLVFFKLNSNLI